MEVYGWRDEGRAELHRGRGDERRVEGGDIGSGQKGIELESYQKLEITLNPHQIHKVTPCQGGNVDMGLLLMVALQDTMSQKAVLPIPPKYSSDYLGFLPSQ